ncbi:MAG: NAD(P)/FAD-dependent oxidoreductase [Bacteroidota bacterium]
MMTRIEFIKRSLAVGIGFPLLSSLLTACEDEGLILPTGGENFEGKVLIIGAGAAGLTAAYLLNKLNIDFEVLEAAADFGGRVKRVEGFVDFPLDLGAEWIHTDPNILNQIAGTEKPNQEIETIVYNPQEISLWKEEELKKRDWVKRFYSEHKFKNTTWYGFLENHIVPDIIDRIVFNAPVDQIDYSGDKLWVKTASQNAQSYEADKLIITVPLKILQGDSINFIPALASQKREAIDSITVGDGLKAFIEFEERFYPDVLMFGKLIQAAFEDNKIYYDAAFGKDANRHVLGLFTINEQASEYTDLGTDEKILERILDELDEVFEGQARQHYKQHIIQNWTAEPYIQGSYSYHFLGDRAQIMADLFEPIEEKLFFAGEALSDQSQATVHGACESAYAVVSKMLE